MSRAIEVMLSHVENLRMAHEREHNELEEARYVYMNLLVDMTSYTREEKMLPPCLMLLYVYLF